MPPVNLTADRGFHGDWKSAASGGPHGEAAMRGVEHTDEGLLVLLKDTSTHSVEEQGIEQGTF